MKKVLVLALVLLAACSSTTGRGYKNPDAIAYRLNTTAVRVMDASDFGMELENRIVEALKKQGVNAFPATNIVRFARDKDEVQKKIAERGTTEVLAITFGGHTTSETFAYHSTGQATAYGDTAYGSGISVPLKRTERVMQVTAVVYATDKTKIWEASTQKWAQGTLMADDRSIMKGNVSELIDLMKKDGLLP
jgi:hypothetical protein